MEARQCTVIRYPRQKRTSSFINEEIAPIDVGYLSWYLEVCLAAIDVILNNEHIATPAMYGP